MTSRKRGFGDKVPFSFLCTMKCRLIIVLALTALSLLLYAQPKSYLCMKPSSEIIIDGKLDEWAGTPETGDFIDISGDPGLEPLHKTSARIMWDSNYLYIAAEIEEPHLWATITERDAVIYQDND